jgi:ribulose-phosphate 3-epimerase
MVLLMSVNPGFGGQRFIPATLDKVRTLKQEITKRGLSVLIEVDGGVNPSNAAQLCEAGADILVAGTAVFGQSDYGEAIKALQSQAA